LDCNGIATIVGEDGQEYEVCIDEWVVEIIFDSEQAVERFGPWLV